MGFEFDGANAVPNESRPAHKSASEPGSWAKDASHPGAGDGTVISASLMNQIVANLRQLATTFGVPLTDGADDILANAVIAAIGATAPAGHVHANATSGADGFMSSSDKQKLDALINNFKGAFADLAALEAAFPAASASAGEWAILTQGVGVDATVAVLDSDEAPVVWTDTGVTQIGTIESSNITVTQTGASTATDGQEWFANLQNGHETQQTELDDHESRVAALEAVGDPLAGLFPTHITGFAPTRVDSNTVSFTPGATRSSDDAVFIKLAATMEKDFNNAWVAGNGNGGDDGTGMPADGSYHFYAISDDSGTTTDIIGSQTGPSTGPTLPGGYTKYRRVHSCRTASGSFQKFYAFEMQGGGLFVDVQPVNSFNDDWTTTAADITVFVPTDIQVIARLNANLTHNVTGRAIIYSKHHADSDIDATDSSIADIEVNNNTAARNHKEVSRITNTSAQVRIDANATVDGHIVTLGWTDMRTG